MGTNLSTTIAAQEATKVAQQQQAASQAEEKDDMEGDANTNTDAVDQTEFEEDGFSKKSLLISGEDARGAFARARVFWLTDFNAGRYVRLCNGASESVYLNAFSLRSRVKQTKFKFPDVELPPSTRFACLFLLLFSRISLSIVGVHVVPKYEC
jgi:hypothetical protein